VEDLQRRQVGFRSLHDRIDTTGRSLVWHRNLDRIHRMNRMRLLSLSWAILSIL
jgi:hypothetical protein